MQMLTKFESKSSRAKSVAFHPKRPWILVSLYSSTIQLWDYRMGTIIDRFEGHEGPVRGVAFHKTQPLFASCGDDYTVRVWSTQTRKCLFVLQGHLDYVRTVCFHDDLPWIMSASDDQTIRIWNWQNRKEIACLTGHNHYVMCAQFHPKDDLIVSASFDQTVRVWDISGLRKKHSAPQNQNQFAARGAAMDARMYSASPSPGGPNGAQQDIFGNTDAVVKFVLEGHDRGVNWATFHPGGSLIISCGDDRVVKTWRMSETKAYEVDTFRGHLNAVHCCLFHPFHDMVLSVSEDRTIRTWDLTKRVPIQQFKRDGDKFWCIAAHPTLNLFVAAHDSGVMVFKLERERPAFAVNQNTVFFANREKEIVKYEIGAAAGSARGLTRQSTAHTAAGSSPVLSLKKVGNSWVPIRSMSYNPAERLVLVTTKSADSNGNIYGLIPVPKDAAGAIEPTGTLSGVGDSAVFISRSRFAVLKTNEQIIEVMDLKNTLSKSVKSPIDATDMVYGGQQGVVLLLGSNSVCLFDIQQRKVIGEPAPIRGTKYVSWSNDGQYIALLAKHRITIVNKNLETVSFIHETIRIKSAVWDDSNVLIYSTLNHLKYCLLNSDNGILKTLQNTVYLTKVKNNLVYCLSRGGVLETLKIDPTEYRFKKALVNKNFNEVIRLIKSSQLVGQSIIAYLQKKGFPEVALQFVQDPQTKFDLAIECGNLSVAFEQAKELAKPAAWEILGKEALAQGNHDIVEDIYQKQRDFDQLAFIYLITGNNGRLEKMEQIADHRNDSAARFQTSIFLNSVESRIQLLKDGGLYPLAYALAKSSGLVDVAEEILAEAGVSENDIQVSVNDISEDNVPGISHPTYKENWPLKKMSLSFFERALMGDVSVDEVAANDTGIDGVTSGVNDLSLNGDDAVESGDAAVDVDEGAWELGSEDLGLDDDEPVAAVNGTSASAPSVAHGVAETELWKSSPVPADHVAAGSFETAARLLNQQAGVTNFAPLKSRFLDVYRASKLYMTANEGLDPLVFYVRRRPDEDDDEDDGRSLPLVPGLATLDAALQDAYKAFASNKLELAIESFREILYTVVLTAVSTQEEAAKLVKTIGICRNYILALLIELERRTLPATGDENIKRSLELAAYFTVPKLEGAHAVIPLRQAMRLHFKHKNFDHAGYFAKKYLEKVANGDTSATGADVAEKIAAKAAQSPLNAIGIDFDQFQDFDICPSTFSPIREGSAFEVEPLTGTKYKPEAKGSLCKISQITTVGASVSRLQFMINQDNSIWKS